MAFNFGAPAPGPAAGGSGVSFGAPASSSSTGFAFGAAPAAATGSTPASAATSFGAAPSTSAPSTGTSAPAPSAGGFSFGGSASAPATGTPAPAPAAGGFGFGGNTQAPAAGSTPASAFVSTANAAGTPATNTPSTPATAATVPDYGVIFPNMKILAKLECLLIKASEDTDEGKLAAQELMHVLNCSSADSDVFGSQLAKPQALGWKNKDVALRDRLKAHPTVTLHGSPASLTPGMLDEVFALSDELRISELEALSLYGEASQPEKRAWLQEELGTGFVDHALTGSVDSIVFGNNVMRAARELYFYERSCALKAVRMLAQYRMQLNTFIVTASDQLLNAGLIDNLVALVREWTRQVDGLERELSSTSTPAQNTFGQTPTSAEQPRFARVLLAFAQGERQMTSECLFYLTYQTQCTAAEVASIIDLVKDLTNGTSPATGLPLLDPFRDVPSAFHDQGTVHQYANQFAGQFGAPFASHPVREKDPVEWEKELVAQVWKGGKPRLLQCVSSLVLAVVCAMDSRHELIDRTTHAVNAFGTGNALFPPQSTDTQMLVPLHTRLNPNDDAGRDWRRKDIWGIFVASYALLLRSLPSVANSPRPGGSAVPVSPRSQGPIDIKTTWRASMVAPSQVKSFSFARLCLIPSFPRHQDGPDAMCDSYEFYMSVLSLFTSHYLDILCASRDVPISRAKWEHDAEQELQFRQTQQQRQRQFAAWSGTPGGEDVLPAGVDLMARPDCMDDVMALAISLASLGPKYAESFWAKSREEIDGSIRITLKPSRALQKLEIQHESDTSLLPVYVSFLSALALAPAPEGSVSSGATLVNNMLSRTPPEDGKNPVTWSTLMEAIRWYARELSPGDYRATKRSTDSASTTAGIAGRESTAYYYGADGNGYDGMAGYSSSQQGTSAASSADTRPKELGETNTNILLSHLAVLANVASMAPTARSSLVSMKLPTHGQDVTSSDPLLTVLFLLAISPLTPLVRGSVFSTIASLLKLEGTDAESGKVVKEHAKKSWDLLESCQVLPISLLDQYEPLRTGATSPSQGLVFPPSSLSLVGNGTSGAWLPPDQKYGILFEMEQVESRSGYYPSTEGFLQLLTSLFISAGAPTDLGASSRPRPGCTPYIEYVANFVLPRALGTHEDKPPLSFRTIGDKVRLVSRSLEAIESVLVRYTVPPPPLLPAETSVPALVDENNIQKMRINEASDMFHLPTLVEKIVVKPNEEDAASFARDYSHNEVVKVQPSSDSVDSFHTPNSVGIVSPTPSRALGGPPIPCAKTPGFTVLTEILCAGTGTLFMSLMKVLTDDGGERGIRSVCRVNSDENRATWALFGPTRATLLSARTRSSDGSHYTSHASLLDPLHPPIDTFAASADDAVHWRETTVIHALRILCAAAAREEAFTKACEGQKLLKIVPVLRFEPRRVPPSSIIVHNVQVSRLVSLFLSFGASVSRFGVRLEALPAIVQYSQCCASSTDHDAEMASPSVALTFYASRSLGTYDGIRALCGTSRDGLARFAKAIGWRLSRSCLRAASRVEANIASLILDSILDTFRGGCAREISISHVILGLPFITRDGIYIDGTYENALPVSGNGKNTRDCFDSILEQISDTGFLLDSQSSFLAVQCFEILYRLTEVRDGNAAEARRIGYANARLRSNHFWTGKLMCLLAKRSDGEKSILQSVVSLPPGHRPKGIENVFHCLAWLLKSASTELVPSTPIVSDSGSILFSSPYQLLMSLLQSMPIAKDGIGQLDPDGAAPRSIELLSAARVPMKGPPEVVGSYLMVNETKLISQTALTAAIDQSDESKQKALEWADAWNDWVRWDCASTHLAMGVLCLVESSMNSSRAFGRQWTGSSLGMYRANEPLTLLLRRLVDECNGRSMDDMLSSGVAYNLSRIVLFLTEKLASANAGSLASNGPKDESCFDICRLLAIEVTLSSPADQRRPLIHSERLRTANFGLALSMAIKSDSDKENLDGMLSHVEGATLALANLACSDESITRPGELGANGEQSACASAQVALIALLDLYREDENRSVVTVMTEPMHRGQRYLVVQGIVSLIAHQDEKIYRVVEKIALCKEGPDLLLDAQLLEALSKAALDYAAEEERARADFRYQNVSFTIPPFFKGHMSLLKTLLDSSWVPPNRQSQVSSGALNVLLDNTNLMERMIYSFPHDVYGLEDCMRCFSLVAKGENLEPLLSDEQSPRWDSSVSQLAYRLSQNPFPRSLLPSLPVRLADSGRSVSVSGHVAVSGANTDASWWDEIENASRGDIESDTILLPDPPTGKAQGFGFSRSGGFENQWSNKKYDVTIAASETLDACLAFLESRACMRPLLALDGLALARGLCRYADAATAIQSRLGFLADALQGTANQNSAGIGGTEQDALLQTRKLERQYLAKLAPIFRRCTERLLLICSSYLRTLMRLPDGTDGLRAAMIGFSQAVSAALEYTKLSVTGIGLSSSGQTGSVDDNREVQIAKSLQADISKVPK